MTEVVIRDEAPGDYDTIYTVVRDAFADRPYADGDEQDLVNLLRKRSGLAVALVATIDDEVVGHIAFSPAEAADGSGPWFGLGPVSVRPDLQLQGIGGQLIRQGLERIKALSAVGCILVGNPDYYHRFGFELSPANVPPGEPAEYFQMLMLSGDKPEGPIHFHAAFEELGQH